MSTLKRKPPLCAVPDCPRFRSTAIRCHAHSKELRETDPVEYRRILGLTKSQQDDLAARTRNPLPQKWEWMGDSDALAAMAGGENSND